MHRSFDVLIRALFERQLDVEPDRRAASLPRAAVGRLHDAGPAAGDDGEARLGEAACSLRGGPVVRIVRLGPRGPEERHARVHAGEGVEALHELAHDPQYTPRIGRNEVAPAFAGMRDAEETLVRGRTEMPRSAPTFAV